MSNILSIYLSAYLFFLCDYLSSYRILNNVSSDILPATLAQPERWRMDAAPFFSFAENP